MTCLFSLGLGGAASAQSIEDQARIDYESAKLAFVRGDFRLALSKVESVIEVLGPDPALLTFAAGAAFENRDVPGARGYAKRAYAAADPMFKGSESYQLLIALSARIDLEGPQIEARKAAAEVQLEAREAAAEVQRLGYWADAQTGLMWGARDNGADLNWDDARKYCDELLAGGFSDWRLPTIGELEQLHDPNAVWEPKRGKLKGPIAFAGHWAWSSTSPPSSPARKMTYAWVMDPILGSREPVAHAHATPRALCARP